VARKGSSRRTDPEEWKGHRERARDFLHASGDLLDLSNEGAGGNPSMSQALLAVIAYGDALTIRFGGVRNTQDHQALPQTLRRVLGERANAAQLSRASRLIARKNEIQYEHSAAPLDDARNYLEQAKRFAEWAEETLAIP
jgi:hypothetical protein